MRKAFTLIELSIVLVIIGLIVGGILVGRDLISAAGVRAQISQIEKYQSAVNTFRGKYNYLPGDIPNPDAGNFGFLTRGPYAGQGDGNGIISGNLSNQSTTECTVMLHPCPISGEEAMFWVDLSTAKLMDGGFSKATPTKVSSASSGATISQYLPSAKLNSGYVYVWSGGYSVLSSAATGNGINYFAITGITSLSAAGGDAETPTMTVAQAYSIDKKIDDGLPQNGKVLALSGHSESGGGYTSGDGWAIGSPSFVSGDNNTSTDSGPVTSAAGISPATTVSCYDGTNGLPEQYSTTQNGALMNCWLSVQFQ